MAGVAKEGRVRSNSADRPNLAAPHRRNATRDPERHQAIATVTEIRARLAKRGVRTKTEVHKARGEWIVTVEMRVEDFATLR